MSILDLALAACALAFLLSLIRAGIGPTLADRTAAADLCLFVVAAALGIVAARSGQALFVDVVLISTLLGFVATVAFARLLLRR